MVSPEPVVPPPGAPFAAPGLLLGQQGLMVMTRTMVMMFMVPTALGVCREQGPPVSRSFLWLEPEGGVWRSLGHGSDRAG